MAYIYKTTCLTTDKIYIGQHNAKKKNYLGSGIALKRAVKKYGKENFIVEILVDGDFNQDLLNELETHYIRLYNSCSEKGYNLRPDGATQSGFKFSKEQRERHSLILKNALRQPHSLETKKRIGEANRGKVRSEELKKHLSDVQKGRPRADYDIWVKSVTKLHKPVNQYSLSGEYIQTFDSVTETAKVMNVDTGSITTCCKGRRKVCKGFIYKYKE